MKMKTCDGALSRRSLILTIISFSLWNGVLAGDTVNNFHTGVGYWRESGYVHKGSKLSGKHISYVEIHNHKLRWQDGAQSSVELNLLTELRNDHATGTIMNDQEGSGSIIRNGTAVTLKYKRNNGLGDRSDGEHTFTMDDEKTAKELYKKIRYFRLKDVQTTMITFKPTLPIGMDLVGSKITRVHPSMQAAGLGVQVGCTVIGVEQVRYSRTTAISGEDGKKKQILVLLEGARNGGHDYTVTFLENNPTRGKCSGNALEGEPNAPVDALEECPGGRLISAQDARCSGCRSTWLNTFNNSKTYKCELMCKGVWKEEVLTMAREKDTSIPLIKLSYTYDDVDARTTTAIKRQDAQNEFDTQLLLDPLSRDPARWKRKTTDLQVLLDKAIAKDNAAQASTKEYFVTPTFTTKNEVNDAGDVTRTTIFFPEAYIVKVNNTNGNWEWDNAVCVLSFTGQQLQDDLIRLVRDFRIAFTDDYEVLKGQVVKDHKDKIADRENIIADRENKIADREDKIRALEAEKIQLQTRHDNKIIELETEKVQLEQAHNNTLNAEKRRLTVEHTNATRSLKREHEMAKTLTDGKVKDLQSKIKKLESKNAETVRDWMLIGGCFLIGSIVAFGLVYCFLKGISPKPAANVRESYHNLEAGRVRRVKRPKPIKARPLDRVRPAPRPVRAKPVKARPLNRVRPAPRLERAKPVKARPVPKSGKENNRR